MQSAFPCKQPPSLFIPSPASFFCRGLWLYLAYVIDPLMFPRFVSHTISYKGRPRPSMHGSKTKGRRTRNERRRKPSISTPRFNRNKAKLVDINLAPLRHRIFPTVRLPRLPLPLRPTAHTVYPRDRSRTTLSPTRLSNRCTPAIVINIIIHIIVITCDPHLHLSAHRIIRGISPRFCPIRPPPLRIARCSRGD